MKLLAFLLLVSFSLFTFATDPFTSIYSEVQVGTTENQSLRGDVDDIKQGDDAKFYFFQFGDTDSIFGGLTASNEGDAQSVSLTAINYNLWLGGNKKIPFQLFLTETSSTGTNNDDANTSKILTPESGFAVKFPFLWVYQSSGDEFCAFLKDGNTVGHCAVGGDLTINYKTLKGEDNFEENAYGATLRFGASLLFPVLEPDTNKDQGYLAFSGKLVYAKTNIDDPSKIFSPIIDAEGNTIAFDDSIISTELSIKWSIQDKFSLSVKWMKPLGSNEYIDDIVGFSLDTQF